MSSIEAIANPFSGEIRPSSSSPSPLVEVESQRAIAETQAAMMIARKFPRDPILVADRILNACTRPSLAESALYSYSRGGSEITGPSIRLAEVLAQEWGNVQFGIRELDQAHGESTVEAYCWDIERNVRQVKIFKVKHVRNTKKGTYSLEDSRDIYELVANNGARRLRACILGVIPGDVVEMAVKACEQTMSAKVPVTPERVTKMLELFSSFGVTKEQIEKRIQRRFDALTPALMVNLGKILNSLKDGMSSPSDWFEIATPPAPEGESKAESLKNKLKEEQKGMGSGENATHPSTPVADPDLIRKKISKDLLDAKNMYPENERKSLVDGFMKTFGIEKIGELPEDRFEEAAKMVVEIRENAPKV